MSFMFPSPKKVPDITPIAPPNVAKATLTTEEIKAEEVAAKAEETKIIEAEKKKLTKGRTRRGTILTSPQGIITPANVQTKSLLGQ